MLVIDIFTAALPGTFFLIILRLIHFLEAPRGSPDPETYEAGYYPLEPGKRPLRMQYLKRIAAFLAADGFLALLVFLPRATKELALNILLGLGFVLGATFKLKRGEALWA